jgi:hypothetical protein
MSKFVCGMRNEDEDERGVSGTVTFEVFVGFACPSTVGDISFTDVLMAKSTYGKSHK